MGETTNVVAVFVVMVLATQVSRVGPLLFSGLTLPKELQNWLGHVPVAILAALVLPELVGPTGSFSGVNSGYILAAMICFVVGIKYKNLLTTTFVGIITTALLRLF